MLSPVGLPPQLPQPPDPELVPAMDRAISIPASVGDAARWQVGTLLTATVRYQNDELLFKVGDHFFTSRPIPGVSEYSRLSLLVARDMSGALSLVPLLPLAGKTVARVGGAPPPLGRIAPDGLSPEDVTITAASLPVLPPRAPPVRLAGSAVRSLSARLQAPDSLADWLFGADMGTDTASTAAVLNTAAVATPVTGSLAGWMGALTSALSQSGLFFEAQLRDKRPVSTGDMKRRLLEIIESGKDGGLVSDAWAALDDLVGLQSAATAAHRSGGVCFSFLMPGPDGVGGWWITLQRDPESGGMDYSGGDGRRDRNAQPWRTRLVGVSLPFGHIDIRIEQIGAAGVGVTILTDTADQHGRWEESRTELARRLQEAKLSLSRWSVMAPQLDSPPPNSPGQLQSLRI